MKVFKSVILLAGLFMLLGANAMAVSNPFEELKGVALGKASLDISGNLRFRYEYQNNYNIKKYTNTKDNYLLERIRLNISLKTQKELKAFIQFQDSHCIDCALTVDDFKGKCPYVNEMELRQAYLEWHKISGSPFGFKIGRQQLAYRDRRVFGPGAWGNVGRYTWDTFMLKYETSYVNLDAFFAKRIFYRPKAFLDRHYPYDVYALYGQIKQLPVDLDVFYVFKYNSSVVTDEFGNFFPKEQRHTIGFYLKGKQPLYGKDYFLSYSGLYAYQTGSYPSKDKHISAYGWYANLGLNYKLFIPQSFWLKYSYGSGDKDPNDNKIQTFDGIFSGMAEYFGRMNLFCWDNIKDYQLTYQSKPIKGLKIVIDHHWFYLAQKTDYWYYFNCKPVQDRKPPFSSNYLGREWDVFVIYDLNKNLQFQFGCCRFSPGTAIIESGFHEKADYVIFQTFIKF
jgi:hypothetical protein